MRAKTIKLLEAKIRINLHDLGSGNEFLNTIPKAQVTKDKTEKERVSQSSMRDTKKSTTRTLATPHFKMALTMGNGIFFGDL